MHILFVHQNFPAQFGHIAAHLVEKERFRCTFASQQPPGITAGVERIQYRVKSGATAQTHYCSRTFENAIWHAHAVFDALKSRKDIQPDLIVGHSGFTSTLFLRELYDCPMINYFEFFYRTKDSDMDFRSDFPTEEITRLRAYARNALLLTDLENGNAAYSPTEYQKSLMPKIFHDKIRVIFDGIDTTIWKPVENRSRRIGTREIPSGTKIVSYVSRGFESMRGFDLFMKVAKRICDERNDVVFVVVGEDRVCYGGDEKFTGGKTFKEWVLSQDNYDLDRILFTGRIPPTQLVDLFSLSDLHIYLTVPFVLSWSLMNALSCGTTVLASNTAPVREMIAHEQNGLLVDFFDVDGFVTQAHKVLDDSTAFRPLGEAGIAMIREKYSLDVCLPKILEFYREVTNSSPDSNSSQPKSESEAY